MSSVANAAQPKAAQPTPPRTEIPYVAFIWFFALLAVCYFPVLKHLIWQWNNDEDMGHGFFVPAIAAYIAWQRKDELFGRGLKPNYLGLAVLAFAAAQLMVATLGAELFLARTAFIESIIGITLLLGGWEALRVLTFPLMLLFFMVPIPAVIYSQITLPLQIFASEVAEFALNMIGIPVLREGNVLHLPSQTLSVVEACSGIRSLLSLTFLSLVYGYFFETKIWMRVILFFATIPIAILANAGRVTITGILSEYNTEYAHGFMHTMSGWVIFMIALAMMVVVHQVLNKLYTIRQQAALEAVE